MLLEEPNLLLGVERLQYTLYNTVNEFTSSVLSYHQKHTKSSALQCEQPWRTQDSASDVLQNHISQIIILVIM